MEDETTPRINRALKQLAVETQELQMLRALQLNLTLYRLTEQGTVEPVSVREYFTS